MNNNWMYNDSNSLTFAKNSSTSKHPTSDLFGAFSKAL